LTRLDITGINQPSLEKRKTEPSGYDASTNDRLFSYEFILTLRFAFRQKVTRSHMRSDPYGDLNRNYRLLALEELRSSARHIHAWTLHNGYNQDHSMESESICERVTCCQKQSVAGIHLL